MFQGIPNLTPKVYMFVFSLPQPFFFCCYSVFSFKIQKNYYYYYFVIFSNLLIYLFLKKKLD